MANSRSAAPRLCLVTPATVEPAAFAAVLDAALAAGDVASLIITSAAPAPAVRQRIAEVLVPVAQRHGVAALVHNDTRIAGRSGADGVHVDTGLADLKDAAARLRPKMIVGAGGAGSRHEAMMLGEADPDYIFFGRLHGDSDDAMHPRTADLGAWWAPLFEIPAMVMAGGVLASVSEAAATGAEFVAVGRAVWEHPEGAAAAVTAANRLLAGARLPA
jgi:thiamine-phosphate pyrophosphorylase